MNKQALLIIDLQNDYFPEGKYPLWNTQNVLSNVKTAIKKAQAKNIPVILVQHIADAAPGSAPFFNESSKGAEIHPDILKTASNADIVIKKFADSFEHTQLENTLQKYAINELLLCGMMTQNCITHTALSKAAEKYQLNILEDCCTSVDKMIHNIALRAISKRIRLISAEQAFAE